MEGILNAIVLNLPLILCLLAGVSLLVVGTNIALNLILRIFLGANGLALATSIAGWVGTVTMLILLRKRFGDYPESLYVVMGKVKKDKYYPYHPMTVMLLCAFLPLILGASVGPEAGLTGIIAALCYWVGDNVTYAKEHAEEYSDKGCEEKWWFRYGFAYSTTGAYDFSRN